MLSKLERHALRKAVRNVTEVTELELVEMHPTEARIARAEMRKRDFFLHVMSENYYRRYGLARILSKGCDLRP